MTIAPATVVDTFSLTSSNAWGATDSGHSWVASGSVVLKQNYGWGSIVNMANTGMGNVRIPLASYKIPQQKVDSILMRVKWTSPAAYPLTDFGPMLSRTGNTFYYFALQGNWSEVALGVYVNGYRYEMNRKSVSITKNTDYWVRYERHATGMRGKVWKDGTPEPSAWTITSLLWDGSQPIGAGEPGIFKKGTRDSHDIEVKDFYYYASGVSDDKDLAADDFERAVSDGWGVSSSDHLWQGSVTPDPEYYKNASNATTSISGGRASISIPSTTEAAGFLGRAVGGDIEAYSRFLIGSSSGNGKYRLGLRGTRGSSAGSVVVSGYMVQVESDQSYINIYSKTATGAYVQIASGTGVTISPNSIYKLRFQVVGTTLKARVWADGAAEPTTWQVTGTSSLFSSGQLWTAFAQTVTGARTFYLYDIMYKAPTIDPPPAGQPAPVNNFTTTGNILVTPGETSASFTATRSNDENNNASLTIKYKPTTASSWKTYTGGTTKSGASNINWAITGLLPQTAYNLQVTWNDPDGVVGANPKSIVFSTTGKGLAGSNIKVSNVTTDQATITATYLRDDDNDSTATLSYRESTMEKAVVEDYFVDEDDGEYLQNIDSVRGGEWEKHPTMTQTVQSVRHNMRFYIDSKTADDKALYYHTNATPVSEYDVEATFFVPRLNGHTGVAARVDPVTETYYGAGIDGTNNLWEIFKVVNGVKTVLETEAFTTLIGVLYDIRLVVRDAYKALVVNGQEILRTDDNEITSQGFGGYYAHGIVEGTPDNQLTLAAFHVVYRTAAGSWITSGTMTVNRATKTFTRTATGLDADMVYEFRVVFSDPNGVAGTNPLLITAQTPGAAVALSSMGVSTYPTSAVVDVFYDYDTNNNSYVDFKYKSIMDTIWTTMPFMNGRADRTIKKFSVTLTNLVPSMTYEIQAIVTDPDGLMQGTPETLYGLFTTEGFLAQNQKKTKTFMWKVYDRKDKYLGTLPDAPEPEFSLHQNGGVTDLSFKLNRTMSSLDSEGFIRFQNRVDIWALDPSSDGMGPNMIVDSDCDASVGAWLHSTASSYASTGGPDGGSAILINAPNASIYETLSNPIELPSLSPLVVSCVAKAVSAKLRMYVRAYDVNNDVISSSDEIAETVGVDWQKLYIDYVPPEGTSYIRVVLRNVGRGVMYADKFTVLSKEVLIYRGRIESFTPRVDQGGEEVTVEVLGLASLLSDDYIEFLQFVETQPQKDIEAKRKNHGAKDPAEMMKFVIDEAKRNNPSFTLYYTTDSIKYTGQLAQYTIRDQQIRTAMDKIRSLCPAGWYYYIEPDGRVVLQGPEHGTTHLLRLGVEILEFEVEKSIRNLKNWVRVKGRQDEDKNEPDGHGSINYIAFDQKSIDKYGKRTLYIRDAQITDPETAKLMGDGRLDENNREEQRAKCYVPDEKGYYFQTGSLRGYNIEAFRPGDSVVIIDPVAGGRTTYWNKFSWDEDAWDMSNVFRPLPEPVPIVTIQNHGSYAQLDLSERPPSSVGDFSRLFRWMSTKDTGD